MKSKSFGLSILLFAITASSQPMDRLNIPCKPLSQMAWDLDQLARTSARADLLDWDVYYYDLDFSFDIDSGLIYGRTEIHFKSTSSDLEQFELNLQSNMSVDSVYLNGVSFSHSSNILSISLDGSYAVDESISVGIYYHGHPPESDFHGFRFGTQDYTEDGIPMLSSLSEPFGARFWWPCKDIPSDKADSARITITVEEELTAVANGLLTSLTDNGDGTKTWVWEHKYPICTYLISVAITEYEYWNDTFHFADGDSMLLEYWIYPSDATIRNIARWNKTSTMLEVFNDAFGKYPFSDEKYGMAQFNWGGGAMEHQTCSSMGISTEPVIAHELAHQWWGNLVTCSDFRHIWINEGFATYSEAIYYGALYGEDSYNWVMSSIDLDYEGTVYRANLSNLWSIFDYIVYGKGAWVLHMLRHVIGDEIFFETLTQFRQTYQHSNASTEDFQAVAEAVWGQDLEWFFDQWIYGFGKPNYRWWWNATPLDASGNSEVSIHIDQTQSGHEPTFRMPIDLTFESPDDDTSLVIWDFLREQDFTIQLDFEPTAVLFDPDVWIHKLSSQTTGIDFQAHQPNAFQLLKAYPNPFNDMITILFTLSSRFEGSLDIFDINGKRVYTRGVFYDKPGTYNITWNGIDDRGEALESGVYIFRINSTAYVADSRKILLLK